MCVHACVRARARVRVCVRACVCVDARVLATYQWIGRVEKGCNLTK